MLELGVMCFRERILCEWELIRESLLRFVEHTEMHERKSIEEAPCRFGEGGWPEYFAAGDIGQKATLEDCC